ncbi:flagellar biosynthesis protein FlhB [Streptococcus loxodontisalivarius]|uniref:Flagellar biosynthesis protein FlhB n=1 Tax=Streptococcus loxodontisalivarius TaxID=1349415 RepID=A0ABS2PPP8_9STRE|nr:flagellar biosynthesis protein FlhB [Streptococcus loxodontisalivarius]
MDNLIKLAEMLGVSLDQLVLGKTPEKTLERVIERREIDIKKIIKVFWIIFGNLLLAVFLLLVFYGFLDYFALTSFWQK